jgi:antitoxin component YwqK of YwqJK toxin-antitoxin module
LAESGEIQNGNREGAWKTYFRESGKLKEEVEYSRGQQSGLKNLYFESGQLRASGRMVDGAKEDEWHWYHENGKTSVTVTFKNGKKHGKEIRNNTRGMIVQEVYYEDGVLI